MMVHRSVLFLSAMCLVLMSVAVYGQQKKEPPLNGGFIQYDEDVLKQLEQKGWKTVLNRMKALGMKVVIIQFLGEATDTGKEPPPFLFERFKTTDPTPMILDLAKDLNMDVYLGLLSPPCDSNAKPGFWKPEKLGAFATANCLFAKQVAQKYPTLKGWYIPLENWIGKYPGKGSGGAEEYPDAWRRFYTDVTVACKAGACGKAVNLPVAISPCLPCPSSLLDPAKAIPIYEPMLEGTKLDIVMLQDSVGAKPKIWSAEKAAAYLGPLKQLCTKHNMQLWSNVESFETRGLTSLPCSFERFEGQLTATKGVDQRVTFDFFHYMNGAVFLKRWEKIPNYEDRMKQLHDQYKKKYVE